jgi:hypothetical protein
MLTPSCSAMSVEYSKQPLIFFSRKSQDTCQSQYDLISRNILGAASYLGPQSSQTYFSSVSIFFDISGIRFALVLDMELFFKKVWGLGEIFW